MTISFTNPGEIDPRAFTLLGLSAKDSTSAIGRFGTGLKYAIAITHRLGGTISIWSGLTRYDFEVKSSTFRGKEIKEIEIITPGSSFPAPFTADYGKDWEPWMALRELESNARDEGGTSSAFRVPPAEGVTTIWVTCPQIEEAYKNLNSIFLSPKTLRVAIPRGYADIHNKDPQLHDLRIYYRSVAVGQFKQPTLFTYNFHTGVYLTEDRSIHYYIRDSLPRWISQTIMKCQDPGTVEKALTARTPHLESELVYPEGRSHYQDDYQVFYSVIRSYVDSGRASLLNPTALRNYYQTFELHDALYEAYTPTAREKALLLDAQMVVAPFFEGKLAPFSLVTSLPEDALGLVFAGKIYLSRKCFGMGLETLVGTLYEEYCHFYEAYVDETRHFQNHLINTIARLSLELAYERNAKK
jgi:hypothetical protein